MPDVGGWLWAGARRWGRFRSLARPPLTAEVRKTVGTVPTVSPFSSCRGGLRDGTVPAVSLFSSCRGGLRDTRNRPCLAVCASQRLRFAWLRLDGRHSLWSESALRAWGEVRGSRSRWAGSPCGGVWANGKGRDLDGLSPYRVSRDQRVANRRRTTTAAVPASARVSARRATRPALAPVAARVASALGSALAAAASGLSPL